jgi:PAS domain S-box-containing protein
MKKKPKTTSRSPKRIIAKAVRRGVKKPVKIGTRPAPAAPWIDDKLFRTLIENSSDAFALSDPKGNILYRSSSAKVISGSPDSKTLSTSMFDRIWPEDLKTARKLFAEMLAHPGKKIPFQVRVNGKNGKLKWIDGTGVNWLAKPGLQALVLHFRDVTEVKEATTALEESERRYRGLFENARLAVFQSTMKGKFIQVNNEFARMFGYLSPEDVFNSVRDIEKDIFADPSRRGEILRLRAKDPRLTTFENLYRRKDGSTFWGRLTVHTVMDADQKALYFEGFIEDITKNRAMEEALRESEEKFRSIFQNSNTGMALVGLDGRYLMVNPALCDILGYTAEELLAIDFFKLTHPDDMEISRKAMLGVLEGRGKTVRFDKRYLHKDGKTVWTEISSALVCDASGKPLHFVTQVIDITERKQAEEALRESEERYRMLFELSPDSIAVYQDGKIIYANPATFRLLGAKAPEEIIGRPMLDFVHPDYREMVLTRSRRQEREGKSASPAEEKFVRRDGSSVDVEVMAAPFQYRGKLSHLVISRDITERKRADEMLREQEERFRTIFENANVGVCIVGLDERLIQVNRQMSAMFGYSREELERMTVNTIAYPEDADLSPAFMQQAIDGETAQAGFDKRYIHKDGHVIWGHVSSSLVRDSKGSPLYFISHVQDITERKQAEEALRESEEKFAKLFQDAPVLITITDIATGTCLDVNEEALRVFGFTREEIIGNSLIDVGAITCENRTQLVEEAQSRGRIAGSEMNFRAKDGHTVVGLVRGERISISGHDCILVAMIDITERKQADEALRALALRHEALLSAIPEIIMEVDKNKMYTWANPAGKEFFGEDVIGKEAASYFEGEQDTYAAVQALFSGSEDTIYVESWQRRRDGEKRLLAWWCRTLKDDRGSVTGALSTARDISEQRTAEDKIENLSRFPEENPNPVMRMTPDGVLLYANQSSRPFLTEWNIGVGQSIPEDCRELIGEAFASQQGKRIETRIGERIFNCNVTPIVNGGYVNLYARDITDRKMAEEALTRQTEELRQRNLELARVNELTDRRLQQLAAMRTVDMAISSSFKSELVMEILLEQLTSQLKIHAADILIFHPAMQGFRFFCGRGFYAMPSSSEYIRLADSYAGRAAQERRMIKVPRLDEKTDQPKIFPRIAKEGFVSYACLPLIAKGQIKGVMEVCQRDILELGPEEDSFLEMLAGQAAIAVDNAEMFGNLQSSHDELQLAFNSTLAGWARALELRDREVEGETQRTADQAMRLAQMLGESDEDLTHLYRGAILHDIGMMSVPDDILLKHGPLTDEEWTIVRKHPQVAFDILSPVLFLRPALDIPHTHHEKWDGSGYPRGIKGEHIPLAGRIFAVVDVWNALRSDRPYRKAWKDAEADEYIRNQSGKQFDPAIVQAFFRLMSGH